MHADVRVLDEEEDVFGDLTSRSVGEDLREDCSGDSRTSPPRQRRTKTRRMSWTKYRTRLKTKNGYLKDGFVVDDSDDIEDRRRVTKRRMSTS